MVSEQTDRKYWLSINFLYYLHPQIAELVGFKLNKQPPGWWLNYATAFAILCGRKTKIWAYNADIKEGARGATSTGKEKPHNEEAKALSPGVDRRLPSCFRKGKQNYNFQVLWI